MPKPKRSRSLFIASSVALVFSQTAAAELVNGDFETGDLTGWETALTTVSTFGVGFPRVQPFDVDHDGIATSSAQFSVGKSLVIDTPFQSKFGGWISQMIDVPGGDYRFSADVAAFATVGNDEAGLFELIFDGSVYYEGATVASVDLRSIAANVAEWAHLSADLLGVTPGIHSVSVRITRRFYLSAWSSLTESVDNVSFVPIPEPGTAGSILAGLAWISWRRRNRGSQTP